MLQGYSPMILFSGSDKAWEIYLQDTAILKAFTPVLWSKCVRIALYLQKVVWISCPCAWMIQKAQCKLGDEFHLIVIFYFIITPRCLPYSVISGIVFLCFFASLKEYSIQLFQVLRNSVVPQAIIQLKTRRHKTLLPMDKTKYFNHL